MFVLIFQQLFLEAILDILYFPLWWYTGGIKYAAGGAFGLLKSGNSALAPGLWLKNMFVPMYGQYDISGRMVSFFMRLVQIIFRSVALLVWLVVCLIVFVCWLAVPVVIVWGFIRAG